MNSSNSGTYHLPKRYVDAVLAEYPDKDEEWVQRQYARVYNNLECAHEGLTTRV